MTIPTPYQVVVVGGGTMGADVAIVFVSSTPKKLERYIAAAGLGLDGELAIELYAPCPRST